MAEIEEQLQIDVKEVPDAPKANIVLDIPIDDMGDGEANFDVMGTLEKVILPKTQLSNHNILCVWTDAPQDVVFEIKEPKQLVYYFQAQVNDNLRADKTDIFTKIFMSGNYTIRVTSALPASTFHIILVVS